MDANRRQRDMSMERKRNANAATVSSVKTANLSARLIANSRVHCEWHRSYEPKSV